jgi:serine/threonine protein kinase/Flp pilus assembly protein TadD
VSPERWSLLQRLFHRAEELPAEEREPFLDRECATDPGLRRQVLSLLAAAGESALLAEPLGERIDELTSPGATPGDRVGPYRILSELGRGGMGVVYLAERADGAFDQQVALKIVRGVVTSPSAVERFLAERRILAQLEHPNIARILDGGTTREGAPYFAMERVEGEPIDRYCNRRRLTVRERLELFLTVCDAVQHAHRNLVVHRDLKPSNLLVTADGTPKLLDFGIAKLLDPDDGAAGLTRRGELPMTPEYASPEQVRGDPVSVSSDVYALGLLLYELLTGHRAQRVRTSERREVERAVCEELPTRPSTVVGRIRGVKPSEAGASPEDVAAARRTTPSGLRRRLRGDLDTVVLTALHKETDRRYPSVEALAADLRRHLDGQPVEARGDRFGYRAWKFVARHRLGVAAAALLLLGLATSALIAGYGLRQARREARSAAEISGFLERVFRLSDPSESRGRTVTVREVLDRAVERLDQEDAVDQEDVFEPVIDVRLRRTLGTVYANLGLLESSETIQRRAAERGEELLGEHHEETLAALEALGAVVWRRGRYPEAETILRKALEQSRQALGDDAPLTLRTANDLGLAVWRQGRFDEAEAIFSDLLERRRRLGGDRDPLTLETLNNLAGVHYMRGDYGAAETLYERAWREGKQVRGTDHPATLDALNNLAMTYLAQGKLDEARARFEELVELRRRVLGPEHPRTLGTIAKLGNVLTRLGELDQAEALQSSVLAAREKTLGPSHPDTLWSKAFLAQIHLARGELDAAARLREEVLADRRRLLGEDHPDTLESLRGLAEARRDQGRYDEAETLYRQALEGFERSGGEDGYWTVVTLSDLGLLRLQRGRNDEAVSLLAEATSRAERAFPEDAHLRGTLLRRQGRALAAAGRPEEAERRLREASALLGGEDRDEDRDEALERLATVRR